MRRRELPEDLRPTRSAAACEDANYLRDLPVLQVNEQSNVLAIRELVASMGSALTSTIDALRLPLPFAAHSDA